LRLFDFVHQYAAREEDQNYLEKWRPYIVRMNAAASALMTLDKGAHDQALEIVNAGIDRIETLEELEDETFKFEKGRSLTVLRDLAAQIQQTRPVSAVERLERQLRRAIDRQEFERAAELRDRLRELRNRQPAE
jgi:excinuclease UvrABC helicase subunit UvrB